MSKSVEEGDHDRQSVTIPLRTLEKRHEPVCSMIPAAMREVLRVELAF